MHEELSTVLLIIQFSRTYNSFDLFCERPQEGWKSVLSLPSEVKSPFVIIEIEPFSNAADDLCAGYAKTRGPFKANGSPWFKNACTIQPLPTKSESRRHEKCLHPATIRVILATENNKPCAFQPRRTLWAAEFWALSASSP